MTYENRIFRDRMDGVGVISKEEAIAYGWTGPCLRSTGVAGRPESYFRQPDEESWADRWGLDRSADGSRKKSKGLKTDISATRSTSTDNRRVGSGKITRAR